MPAYRAGKFRCNCPKDAQGGWHWFEDRSIQHQLEGGEVTIEGLAIDITSRKQAEEVRNQLTAIVETSEDAIIGKTLDGVITSWNKGAENYSASPKRTAD